MNTSRLPMPPGITLRQAIALHRLRGLRLTPGPRGRLTAAPLH